MVERAVVLWFGCTILGQIWCWLICLTAALNSEVFAAGLFLYSVYFFGPGFKAAETASKEEPPLRRWWVWKYFAQYFNAKLVKTSGEALCCITSVCILCPIF